MTRQRARIRILVVAAAVLVAMAGWWLFSGNDGRRHAAHIASTRLSPTESPPAVESRGPALPQQPSGGAGRQADTLLKSGLRHRFEAMLLAAGETDSVSALKQKLLALLSQHFAPAERERALALLNRYVDYRVALGDMKAEASMDDPRAMRSAIASRQRMRQLHFDKDEYSALFAEEDALDAFTLARMEIARNASLTPAQKQAALKEAESGLSEAQRTARTDLVAYEAVAAQTAAFQSQGTSPQERYAQRQAKFGETAAQQLGQLDREEGDWQARLTQYAHAQQGNASPAQLAQLAGQLFTANEQLRIEAALVLRQQQAAAQTGKP